MDAQAPETKSASQAAPVKSRRLRTLLLAAALLLVGVPLLLRLALAVLLSPQALVDRLESELNARVSIGSVDLSVFSSPAKLVLHDVRLAPRDDAADNAQPLSKRPPMPPAPLAVGSLRLEGSLPALLSRKFDVNALELDQAAADVVVRKNGSLDIDKLFRMPDIVNGKPNPRKAFKPVVENTESSAAGPDAAAAPITIEEMPFAARVQSFVISGSRISADIRKKGTLVDLSGLRVEVTDLDVDPADLANHNRGAIRIQGTLRVAKPSENLEYATIHLLGDGTIRPFDPETRALNPLVQARLTFQGGSESSHLPSLEKSNRKLETLQKEIGRASGRARVYLQMGRTRRSAYP